MPQKPVDIRSAYQLYRVVLKSIEAKVRSRQGRNFLKRRVAEQWRDGRLEQDPQRQRLLIERATACVHVLHMDSSKVPKPDMEVDIDFARKSRPHFSETLPK
jgi:hypothetical protein